MDGHVLGDSHPGQEGECCPAARGLIQTKASGSIFSGELLVSPWIFESTHFNVIFRCTLKRLLYVASYGSAWGWAWLLKINLYSKQTNRNWPLKYWLFCYIINGNYNQDFQFRRMFASISGEASLGLPDGDDQRSPPHGAEAHGRLDHRKCQVEHPFVLEKHPSNFYGAYHRYEQS